MMKKEMARGALGAILLLLSAVDTTRGAAIAWTNSAGGQWRASANWSPNKVPGKNDTAIITNAGNCAVTLDANIEVGALVLGNPTGTQELNVGGRRLTLSSTNAANRVDSGGRIVLNGGALTGQPLLLSGTLDWSGGAIAAPLMVQPAGQINASGAADKLFLTTTLTNLGTFTWSGAGGLLLPRDATFCNAGRFEVANDVEFGNPTNRAFFVNGGTFRKTGGTGATTFGIVEFRNSGSIDLQVGRLEFGSGRHSLSDGTHITGPGALRVNGGELTVNGTLWSDSPLEILAGKLKGNNTLVTGLNWSGGSIEQTTVVEGPVNWRGGKSSSSLTINGPVDFSSGEIASGPVVINGPLAWSGGAITTDKLTVNGDVTWTGGLLSKLLVIGAGRQLLVQDGGAKLIDGGTLENHGLARFAGTEGVAVAGGANIENRGTLVLDLDSPFSGVPCTTCKLFNYGTLRKASGGVTLWGALQLVNHGVLDLVGGEFQLVANAHSLESDSTILGRGSFVLGGAALSVRSNVLCSGPLMITGGVLSGSGPIHADIHWTQGTLDGTVTIPSVRTLLLGGAGTKALNRDAVLNIEGTLRIPDRSKLKLFANATINNSGLVDLEADPPFEFNGSDKALLNNAGMLRRSFSGKHVDFGALQLSNRGLLLGETAGFTFSANTHTFGMGSQLSGLVQVIGATLNLDGSITAGQPLEIVAGVLGGNGTLSGGCTLSGGTLAATLVVHGAFTMNGGLLTGNATVNGPTTWTAGEVKGTLAQQGPMDWQGGTLSGAATLSESSVLSVHPGGTKLITGNLSNGGTVIVANNGQIQVVSGTPLVNHGLFEVQSQMPFKVNGTSKPVFNNRGILRRSGSTSALDFGALILQNSGTLDVLTGGVTFSANSHTFAGGTRLTGPGTVRIAGATVSMDTILQPEAPFELASGYLLGNAAIAGDFKMSGGQLPGVVAVIGQFNWSGGELKGTLTANQGILWSGGWLSGTLNAPAACRFDIADGDLKWMTGTLNNYGTLSLLALSQVQLDSGCVINNAGLCESYAADPFDHKNGATPSFVNTGRFRTLGAGDTSINLDVIFSNNGIVDMASNALSFVSGTHTFGDRSRFVGGGLVRLAGATINWTGAVTNECPLEMASGTVLVNGSINGSVAWAGGTLSGALTIPADCQLRLVGTGTKTLHNITVTNQGSVILEGSGALAFSNDAIVQNHGLLEMQADNAFTTPNSGKKWFNSYGVLRKVNSPRPFLFSSVILKNTGTLDLQTGLVSLTAGTHTLDTGTRVIGPGALQVDGATLTLVGNLSTESPLQLAAGVLQGTATLAGGLELSGGQVLGSLVVNGDVDVTGGEIKGSLTANGAGEWSGGLVSGTLAIPATARLDIQNGGTKTIAGLLDNAGDLRMLDGVTISLATAAPIQNRGTFAFEFEKPFTATVSKPVLNNTGLLRKTGSTKTTEFGTVILQNSGTLELASGDLSLKLNDHFLADGSRTTGPGTLRVDGAELNLAGTLTLGAPFELAGGTLAGNTTLNGSLRWLDGTILNAIILKGSATWSGGILSGSLEMNGALAWSGGTLPGTLTVPTDGALTVNPGKAKIMTGELNNWGNVTVHDPLQMNSGAALNNAGVFEAFTDTPWTYITGGRPVFNNTGRFRKLGPATLAVSEIVEFRQSGVIEVATNTLAFTAGTHSFNAGSQFVGPGTNAINGATITLAGTNVVQGPFTFASGYLNGAGMLAGIWTWTGGQIEAALDLPAGSTLNIAGSGLKFLKKCILNNAGTVVVSGTGPLQFEAGVINNYGMLDVRVDQRFPCVGAGRPAINNTGTLRKSQSAGTLELSEIQLLNSGTLDLQTGNLSLTGYDHSLTDKSSITGAGSLHVAGARLTLAGTTTTAAPLQFTAGNLLGTATLTGPFHWSGGEIDGSLTVAGAASWSSGRLDGTLTIPANNSLAIAGSDFPEIKGGTLNVAGQATITGITLLGNDDGKINNTGTFEAFGTNTIVNTGGGRLLFNNAGSLNLTNGFGLLGGSYKFAQASDGMLRLDIGGRSPATEFSRVTTEEGIALDGTLQVKLVNDFVPAEGDRFELLNFKERVGAFARVAGDTRLISPFYSTTNLVMAAAMPAIVTHPQSQGIVVSNPVSFNVVATGTMPLGYQWYFNNDLLPSATNALLVLSNVPTNWDGFYKVSVSNVWGTVSSTAAKLTVNMPPTLVAHPQSRTVNQGDNVSFTVVASGAYLTYQWKFNGSPIADATNATLQLSNVTANRAGKYKVDVRNVLAQTTSQEAILSVIVPPTITEHPQSQNVNADSTVTLTVKAGGTEPFQYFWVKDGLAIPANNASLVLANVGPNHVGAYSVLVANAAGYDTSQPAYIAINAPPHITLQPVSRTVSAGSNVVFIVAASGVPAPTYQWRKNGVNIPGATSPTLALPSVKPGHSGEYSVVVANRFGTRQSVPAFLEVVVPKLMFTDRFSDRGYIYTVSGYGSSTNTDATSESGEPRHAGKRNATTSVWISWWAPANGIATFTTAGSDFDTVLAVYRGSAVNSLTKVAADDDSAGFHCSTVSFNAQAGTYYEIAVAGVGGASGTLMLGWELDVTSELLPEIVQAPPDQTVIPDATVALQLQFTAFEPTAVQWFYQGQLLPGATNSTITLAHVQANQVGGYAVRLTAASGRTVVSPPGDLQINTEGATQAAARNKLFDALEAALAQ